MKSRLLLILALLSLPLGAQTPKLDPGALDALKEKPVTTAPKFVPKTTGPIVEKSRQYTFTAKGTTKAARVITMTDGTKTEAPLVEVPLHFVKNSTQLADPQSKANLAVLAHHLKEMAATGGKVCIEGHASVEGDTDANQKLSEARAAFIRTQLISTGVSETLLAASVGRGSQDALTKNKNAGEALLAQDRRVLVVREQ